MTRYLNIIRCTIAIYFLTPYENCRSIKYIYRGSQVDVVYEDAEFNCKTASEYKQFDCLGTYDTSSETGKRSVCRGAEVKLRLIVLRTCTCGVILHLHRNKLDVAERGGRGSRGRRPRWKVWLARVHPWSRDDAPFGGFFCRSSLYNKVQFYCRSAGRERALYLPISDKSFFYILKLLLNREKTQRRHYKRDRYCQFYVLLYLARE